MNNVFYEVMKKRVEELRNEILKEKENIKVKVLKTYLRENMFLMVVEIVKKENYFNNNMVVLSMFRDKNKLINQKIEHIGEVNFNEFETFVKEKEFKEFSFSKKYIFINIEEYNKYK